MQGKGVGRRRRQSVRGAKRQSPIWEWSDNDQQGNDDEEGDADKEEEEEVVGGGAGGHLSPSRSHPAPS